MCGGDPAAIEEPPMTAALAFIVIPALYQVRGILQRESSGRPTQQAQQDDENATLTVWCYQHITEIFQGTKSIRIPIPASSL
jgi:hypothetical protein